MVSLWKIFGPLPPDTSCVNTTSTRSLGRIKPPALVSAVTGTPIARMPGVRVAAKKPTAPDRTMLASVIGWPVTNGERTTTPLTTLPRSGSVCLMMNAVDTALFGHASQRTKPASSACPGVMSLEATSTSTVIAGGGALACDAGVPPPNMPLTSSAAAPAAMAATPNMAIRVTFMAGLLRAPQRSTKRFRIGLRKSGRSFAFAEYFGACDQLVAAMRNNSVSGRTTSAAMASATP